MTFFPESEIRGFSFKKRDHKKKKWPGYLSSTVNKLRDYLVHHERIPASFTKGDNAHKFFQQGCAILNNLVDRDLKGDGKRLERAVREFCKIQPDKFTPQVWTVYDFWMKFYQIEAYLERHLEYAPSKRKTASSNRIYKRLKEYHLNKHLQSVLPGCIQKSVDNYAHFIKILRRIRDKHQNCSHEASYVLEYWFGDEVINEEMIVDWFEWMFPLRNEINWPSWEPTNFHLTFSISSYMFYKFFTAVVGHDNPKGMKELVKEIQLENRKLRRQRGTVDPDRTDRIV